MRWTSLALVALGLAVSACDEGTDAPAGPEPQIVTAAGPKDGVLACDPAAGGGSCPLPITVTFRLPKEEFVTKAIVRFQGDGSDNGVDRGYVIAQTNGGGEGVDVPVTVNAILPPTILRRGALFTYTVRLVTGRGAESEGSTLTVSVP